MRHTHGTWDMGRGHRCLTSTPQLPQPLAPASRQTKSQVSEQAIIPSPPPAPPVCLPPHLVLALHGTPKYQHNAPPAPKLQASCHTSPTLPNAVATHAKVCVAMQHPTHPLTIVLKHSRDSVPVCGTHSAGDSDHERRALPCKGRP
jgi:hypothetical protein